MAFRQMREKIQQICTSSSDQGRTPIDTHTHQDQHLQRPLLFSALALTVALLRCPCAQQNMGTLSTARLSLEEAMVLEEMRGLPLEQAHAVLDGVQLDLGTLGLPAGRAEAAGSGAATPREPVPGSARSGSPRGADGDERLWLTVGIPTVPRRDGQDYLTRCDAPSPLRPAACPARRRPAAHLGPEGDGFPTQTCPALQDTGDPAGRAASGSD